MAKLNDGQIMYAEGTIVETLANFIEYIRMVSNNSSLVLYRGQPNMHFPLDAPISRSDLHLKGAILEVEKSMLEDFERRSVPYLGGKVENEWDLLALARHYGLPTRLLDWTTSALAAL